MDFINNIFSVKDKIVIITGGNGQLGSQYAETLIRAGAKVAIFDIHEKLSEKLKSLSLEYPIRFFKVDIINKQEIIDTLEKIKSSWGMPSVLINNAALDSPPGSNGNENKSFEDYSEESWQRVFAVNLTGVFLCCQIIGGAMAKAGQGSIINISSTYGLVSPNQDIYKYRAEVGESFVKPISYSVTKSGILNMTRYLATYWAKAGVRVNTLVPGGVFNNQDEKFLENYSRLTPMGRMAKSNEYNGAIIFLASGASSYMTGSTLVIDGGWTAW